MNTRTLVGATLIAITWSAAAGAAAPEGLFESASQAAEILEQRGFVLDTLQAGRALVEAIVRAADPLGRVMTPEEYAGIRERQSGQGVSIGAKISIQDGRPRVEEVAADSPAAGVGMKPGDVIEMIEGEDTKGMHHMQVVELLRGPESETVHLLVRRADNTVAEWDVGRAAVRLPSVEVAEELPMKLGYIRLNGLFEDDGGAVVLRQLQEWAKGGRYGVVLDLRGAGGTDTPSIVRIASCFAESGAMLFTLRDRKDQDVDVFRAGAESPIGMPVMVLVDENTAGAAEVLAAVLLHSVRGAMVVGAPTAGDFGLREPIALSSGEVLYVATRRLLLADGTSYRGDAGLAPDIVVTARATPAAEYEPPPTAEGLSDEEKQDRQLRERLKGDAVLRRAVDLLLGLKALNIRVLGSPAHSSR